ncbi:hypothetical protein LC048_17965 [Mesobacillus subterraneus]|uniref:hypothetical protein n=1 Tax=Mesobacillus subterraneus TaxID=285983 RepID=UPI00273FC6C8|nr:hypothetical protein [Mesobacillus subterraneus]WLR54313.1 hypothetical protein LC048_17965 [Mesobacillus subterraneus]
MKQRLYLLTVQREMLKNAMRNHRKTLTGMGQQLFDIALIKVGGMNRVVELDGMEMIYISQSLNSYAKKLSNAGKIVDSQHYRMLAMEIEQIRIWFQQTNGTKVHIKKQAASAPTLTA